MQDGQMSKVDTVNDLVTKAAEANKSQGGDNQGNDNNGGAGQGDAGKSAEQIEVDRKAAELAEEQKQQQQQSGDAGKADDKKGDIVDDKGGDKKDVVPDVLAELLKETKFESVDALKAHLQKKDEKQKSPEELKREDEVYRANLVSFAVKEEIMSLEDITKYENLKGKSDDDLVFAEFHDEMEETVEAMIIAERKKEGSDVPPTFDEIQTRIEEEFNKEYPLESENEKIKQRAQNKLARAAKDIRGPIESSYTKAKERFDEERGISEVLPKYVEKLTDIISEEVSEELTVYSEKDGDEDVPASIQLTKEEKDAVVQKAFKKISTPAVFSLYKEGKFEEIAALVKEETDAIIWKDYRERGLAKVAEVFASRGLKKGSDIGAKQSFELNQAKANESKQTEQNAQQSVIDSTRAKKA